MHVPPHEEHRAKPPIPARRRMASWSTPAPFGTLSKRRRPGRFVRELAAAPRASAGASSDTSWCCWVRTSAPHDLGQVSHHPYSAAGVRIYPHHVLILVRIAYAKVLDDTGLCSARAQA